LPFCVLKILSFSRLTFGIRTLVSANPIADEDGCDLRTDGAIAVDDEDLCT